jgi:hypothetical protein
MSDGAAGGGSGDDSTEDDELGGSSTPADRLPETDGAEVDSDSDPEPDSDCDPGTGGRRPSSLRTRIAHELTGSVLDGFAVTADLDAGTVDCTRCGPGDAGRLVAGDRAIVAFTRYEGRTWEPIAVRCPEHAVGRLPAVVDGRAEDQTLVRATLEPTGYRDPLGGDHPDALTLGGIEVLDASPAADGYPD